MKIHRMLASASALMVAAVVVVGCGGSSATETGGSAATAASDAVPAAPAESAAAEPAAAPRLVAAVRGQAELGFTQPQPRREGNMIVTTIRVKNLANAAIAGLKVEEFWYNPAGDPIATDTYRHRQPLQPGEVLDVTLRVPAANITGRPNYKFEHANGEIKPTVMQKIDIE